MSGYEDRLQRCFSLVFPTLPPAEIPNASVARIADWDSLANINLVCVIEEEFGFEFKADDLEGLTSYALILQHLRASATSTAKE
jgi:acyl carrier protein